MLTNTAEIACRVSTENELTPWLISELEEYLKVHPGGRIYHHPLYLKVLSLESQLPYTIIIARDNVGKINGFMNLLETRGLSLGPRAVISSKRISSLPRSSISGPLADDESVTIKLLEKAKELCDSRHGYTLQIKTNIEIDKIVSGFNSIEWRNTYIKKVPPKGEDLKLKKNTKYDIKRSLLKAEENKIIFREAASLKDFQKWYKLYLLVMRYHRVHVRSFQYFKLCRDILLPAGLMQLNLAVIERGNFFEIISGNFNFKFKDIYLSGFKAGQMKKNSLLAGDFLVYNELLLMQENGYQYYDLGETPDNHQSLIKYKLKWGAEPERIYHSFYGHKSKLVKKGLDFRGDTSLSTKIWHFVPLKITEFAGKLINRRL